MNGGQEPWIAGDEKRRTFWSRGCVIKTFVPIFIDNMRSWNEVTGLEVRNTIRMFQGHPHCLACSELHAVTLILCGGVVRIGWTSWVQNPVQKYYKKNCLP